MTPWRIQYLEADGRRRSRVVRAQDAQRACEILGVRKDRFVSASPDYLSMLLLRAPTPRVQMLILSQLSAFAASGRDLGDVLSYLSSHKSLAQHLDKIEWSPNQNLSSLLEQLDFDPAIPALVAAGESSGRLPQMLHEGALYLKQAQDIRRGVNGQLMMGYALLVLAISALIVMPGILGPRLDRLASMSASGVHLDMGLATTLLLGLRDLLAGYGGILFFSAVFGAGLAWRFRSALPVFSTFAALARTRRSVVLLSVMQPLLEAGVNPDQMNRIIVQAVGDGARDLSGEMKGGTSLSQAIERTAQWWSATLVSALHGFESVHATGRAQMLSMLLTALNEEQRDDARKASTTIYLLGALCGVLLIYLIAAGYLLPTMSMRR